VLAQQTTVNQRADVRILVEKSYRSKFTSRQLAGLLRRAAEGQQDERGLPLISPLVAVLISSNRGKGRRR
jgi:hypothetical protein